MMRESFGTHKITKPDGMLRQVVFPSLTTMDVRTGDGRLLKSSGRGVRNLPRTIYAQFVNEQGHAGSVIAGHLDEVTFDDDGNVSARGWLIDDANGRQAALYIKTQTLHHNSVDLAEAKASIAYDEAADALLIDFSEWKIAATTLVGKPAFADAHAALLEDDEIMASLESDEPLVVGCATVINLPVDDDTNEITADGGIVQPWDAFHQPEPAGHRKLTVDHNGWVSGHLGLWDSFHDGIAGRKVRIPRPSDNYASFNKPGVLTERGLVETGPIFLEGGHRRPSNGDHHSAYGGIENTWADVRVIEGRHGPWLSGVVRPGVDEHKVYAARASRISGHWVGDRLKAIVSVNAEGFDVPGGGFAVHEISTDSDGHLLDLVASFDVADVDDTTADVDVATVDTCAQTRLRIMLALLDDDD
jgi:hypothetical protein